MNVTKRTLIATLGLAPLGVGAEAFAAGEIDGTSKYRLGFGQGQADWPERRDHFASALEKLAAEIRADRVVPMKLDVVTSLEANNWEVHHLHLKFECTESPKTS